MNALKDVIYTSSNWHTEVCKKISQVSHSLSVAMFEISVKQSEKADVFRVQVDEPMLL